MREPVPGETGIPFSRRLVWVYALIGIPPLVLIWLGYRYTVNVPWYDDVESFTGFLLEYLNASTWTDKLSVVLRPVNEYRIVFARLLTLLTYLATGTLDFRILIAGGLLCLIGTWALFVWVFVRNRVPLLYLIPLSLLIFQPQFYLTTFWAITGLQHQPVVFFCFLSLYLLAGRNLRYNLMPALLLAIVATFTNGNGMFIWFAGLGILLLQVRFSAAIAWILTGILSMAAYFTGFTTQGNESGPIYAYSHPLETLLAFFTFIGGLFDFMPYSPLRPRVVLPIIAGFFITTWLLFWFSSLLLRPANTPLVLNWRIVRERLSLINTTEMFLVGCMLYLLTTAVIIAVFRLRFGFPVMLISNYKIYPTLFLVLAYSMYVFSPLRRKARPGRQMAIILGASGLISVLSYWQYTPLVIERRKIILSMMVNQVHNGFGLSTLPGTPFAGFVAGIMDQSVARKLYTYPQDSFTTQLSSALAQPTARQQIPVEISYDPEYFVVKNDTVSFPKAVAWSRDAGLFVRVYSPSLNLLFKAEPNPNLGLAGFSWYERGFGVGIPRPMLFGADSCSVQLVRVNDGIMTTYQATQKIKPDTAIPGAGK
ncbi:hypothetical protein GCM10023187_48920 [Nibrella viscosa]|uniref:Uncharacterized protein n=1 Tax=Nibrella viscosa TaxID=1084524 RepID=A0ABP8KUF8_9BACT